MATQQRHPEQPETCFCRAELNRRLPTPAYVNGIRVHPRARHLIHLMGVPYPDPVPGEERAINWDWMKAQCSFSYWEQLKDDDDDTHSFPSGHPLGETNDSDNHEDSEDGPAP